MNLGPTVILKNDKFLRQREDERARVNKRDRNRESQVRGRDIVSERIRKKRYTERKLELGACEGEDEVR